MPPRDLFYFHVNVTQASIPCHILALQYLVADTFGVKGGLTRVNEVVGLSDEAFLFAITSDRGDATDVEFKQKITLVLVIHQEHPSRYI